MLLIVASAWDRVAQALATKWANHGVRLLTPLDLSRKGWRWRLGATTGNSMMINGETLDPVAIRGVLTRLPSVYSREIPHIIPGDREYVAAEMQAFLFAWLSELSCPVLNRPRDFGLSGPPWRREQWIHLADQLGLSVDPVRLEAALGSEYRSALPNYPEAAAITIVGKEHTGALLDPVLISHAYRLAAAAETDLLTVFFCSARADAKFIGTSLLPNLEYPGIADLILQYFGTRGSLTEGTKP